MTLVLATVAGPPVIGTAPPPSLTNNVPAAFRLTMRVLEPVVPVMVRVNVADE
jgi:hypothetical protein